MLPKPQQAEVSIKSQETQEDGAHRRRKDMIQFCVVLLAVIGVLILCLYLAFFDGTRSADEKRWTQSVVFAIVSGFIGFLAGKKS
ncbi:MAG: hypothetical protein IDH49_08655 [Gammaproteobacteria bacterium]|nr:hypothetical protein [Gammaproteobacteria bacterium]